MKNKGGRRTKGRSSVVGQRAEKRPSPDQVVGGEKSGGFSGGGKETPGGKELLYGESKKKNKTPKNFDNSIRPHKRKKKEHQKGGKSEGSRWEKGDNGEVIREIILRKGKPVKGLKDRRNYRRIPGGWVILFEFKQVHEEKRGAGKCNVRKESNVDEKNMLTDVC